MLLNIKIAKLIAFTAATSSLVLLSACMSAGMSAKPGASIGSSPSSGPVGKTIQKNASKFERCGRDSVSVQTGSAQSLQLQFEVQPDGSVAKPDIIAMSSPDPDLYDCITHTLKRIQFPPPPDGQTKKVQYPLVLKPE